VVGLAEGIFSPTDERSRTPRPRPAEREGVEPQTCSDLRGAVRLEDVREDLAARVLIDVSPPPQADPSRAGDCRARSCGPPAGHPGSWSPFEGSYSRGCGRQIAPSSVIRQGV